LTKEGISAKGGLFYHEGHRGKLSAKSEFAKL